jgi:hypothetical protein
MSQAALDTLCPRRSALWIFDGPNWVSGAAPIPSAAEDLIFQSDASCKRCVPRSTPMPRGADGFCPLAPSAPPPWPSLSHATASASALEGCR